MNGGLGRRRPRDHNVMINKCLVELVRLGEPQNARRTSISFIQRLSMQPQCGHRPINTTQPQHAWDKRTEAQTPEPTPSSHFSRLRFRTIYMLPGEPHHHGSAVGNHT